MNSANSLVSVINVCNSHKTKYLPIKFVSCYSGSDGAGMAWVHFIVIKLMSLKFKKVLITRSEGYSMKWPFSTLQWCDVKWVPNHLSSPAYRLFVQRFDQVNTRGNIKVPHQWHFCEESTSTSKYKIVFQRNALQVSPANLESLYPGVSDE